MWNEIVKTNRKEKNEKNEKRGVNGGNLNKTNLSIQVVGEKQKKEKALNKSLLIPSIKRRKSNEPPNKLK